MSKKNRGMDREGRYNAGLAWAAPAQAVTKAEAMAYQVLKVKRANFNALEEKEKRALLGRDPYYCDYVDYQEEIEDGLQITILSDLFIDVAEEYGLKHMVKGQLFTNDFMLVHALVERSQRWISGGPKHRKEMDMPQFAGIGETRKARFWVMQTWLKILDVKRNNANHYAALHKADKQEPILPYTTSAVVTEEESKRQVQGKAHNEDVAKTLAPPAPTNQDMDLQLQLNRLKAENEALKAKEATRTYVDSLPTASVPAPLPLTEPSH